MKRYIPGNTFRGSTVPYGTIYFNSTVDELCICISDTDSSGTDGWVAVLKTGSSTTCP
jgi:hypothetical protein